MHSGFTAYRKKDRYQNGPQDILRIIYAKCIFCIPPKSRGTKMGLKICELINEISDYGPTKDEGMDNPYVHDPKFS